MLRMIKTHYCLTTIFTYRFYSQMNYQEENEALKAELDFYIRLCSEQNQQLNRYAALQKKTLRLLAQLSVNKPDSNSS